ncbi:hypothetical protein [Rhizorhabdus histidinilytica]|uniref:hypothetical protein n=1 Tax=Rhizorhabdus histidinilytica TaxID=439228 RepID=UPI0032202468
MAAQPKTMVYTVDLGDGRVVDIEGPEGATPEQLHAVIAQQPTAGGGQPMDVYTTPVGTTDIPAGQAGDPYGAPEAQEPETTLGGASSAALRGVLGGMSELGSFMNPGKYIADRFFQQPSTDEQMQNLLSWLSLPQADSDTEKLIQAAGKGAGMAGPLALEGGLGAALLSGATAGAAGEATRQAGGGGVAQFLASLAGGLAPSALTAGASTASRAIGNAARSFTRSGAEQRAGDVIRRSITSSPDDVIANIEAAPAAVEGVAPTLAEVAKDAGLAGMQRGHANTDLNTSAAISERAAANALARSQALDEAFATGSPQAIQDLAAQQLKQAETITEAQQIARQAVIDKRLVDQAKAATNETQAARTNLTQAIERLGPAADRDATGTAARDAFDSAYQAAKTRSSEAYSAPVLKRAQPLTIPRGVFMKLRDTADEFYGDGGGEIPSRLQAILSDMADPNATTRTLTNIDRRLADFAGEAKMQGRRAEGEFAERVRGQLASFVEKAAPKEYRDALKNAKAVRSEQGRLFETGTVAPAMARDRFGNPATGDNSLPGKLVRPGAPGGDTAESLIKAIGPETAEKIVREEIRRVAEEQGISSAQQARSFATRYGEAARRFPAVQRDLRELETHAARLDAAQAAEKGAISARATPEEVASVKERHALHDAILASPMAKLADPAVDPASFIGNLIRRQDDGRQLRTLLSQLKGNDAAQDGLRRALGDYIGEAGAGNNFTASGDRIPSINKTRQAIGQVVSRAGPILTQQQKIVLKKISRELENANFAATAAKPAGSETEINRTFKGLLDFVPGSGIVKNVLSKVIEVAGNGDEVKSLITQAVLDPQFAATLLKRQTPQHLSQVERVLRGARSAGSVAGLNAANDTRPLTTILQDRLRAASGASAPAAAEDKQDGR